MSMYQAFCRSFAKRATRHSTATALGEYFSETEIMKAGSMHKTNKAARRYFQDQKNDSIKIYRKVNELQKTKANVIKIEDKAKKFSLMPMSCLPMHKIRKAKRHLSLSWEKKDIFRSLPVT